MSLSSLPGGADSTAFSQILRKECGWPVLAAWFIGCIGQAWDASITEASVVRESLKHFTENSYVKNRLPVYPGHNTPPTLLHSHNDFDFGIRRAHIETVNTATTSLLLELQRGYYL